MKRALACTILSLLSLTGLGVTALAHEEDEDRPIDPQRRQADYQDDREQSRYDGDRHSDREDRGNRLNYEVDHLNRMSAHVNRELRNYGAGRGLLRKYQHVQEEVSQLNNQFRRGEQFYNRRQLHAEVEHIHGELHGIEQALHVRANDLYQWR